MRYGYRIISVKLRTCLNSGCCGLDNWLTWGMETTDDDERTNEWNYLIDCLVSVSCLHLGSLEWKDSPGKMATNERRIRRRLPCSVQSIIICQDSDFGLEPNSTQTSAWHCPSTKGIGWKIIWGFMLALIAQSWKPTPTHLAILCLSTLLILHKIVPLCSVNQRIFPSLSLCLFFCRSKSSDSNLACLTSSPLYSILPIHHNTSILLSWNLSHNTNTHLNPLNPLSWLSIYMFSCL